jgi:hypothetical protein
LITYTLSSLFIPAYNTINDVKKRLIKQLINKRVIPLGKHIEIIKGTIIERQTTIKTFRMTLRKKLFIGRFIILFNSIMRRIRHIVEIPIKHKNTDSGANPSLKRTHETGKHNRFIPPTII